MTEATEAFVILEVAGHPNGKDVRRYLDAIALLRRSSLVGRRVLFVTGENSTGDPTYVRHFGYDYRCGDNCPHSPEPWGVFRYFGLSLILDGQDEHTNMSLLGTVFRVGEYAQVEVTGFAMPRTGHRTELESVENILEKGGACP